MIQANSKKKYLNVMEKMVAEEVNSQMTLLPQKLAKYIKRADVETYALNRLPPLYASSQEGWKFQTKKAEEDYRNEIAVVVRHAFAAVQRDLLKNSTPLFREEVKKVSSSLSQVEGSTAENKQSSKDYNWKHSQYYRLGSSRK